MVWLSIRQEGMLLPHPYCMWLAAPHCCASPPILIGNVHIRLPGIIVKILDFCWRSLHSSVSPLWPIIPKPHLGLPKYAGTGAFVIRPTAEQILQQLQRNPFKTEPVGKEKNSQKEFNKPTIYAKAKLTGIAEGSDKSAMIIPGRSLQRSDWILLASLVCSLSCNGSRRGCRGGCTHRRRGPSFGDHCHHT